MEFGCSYSELHNSYFASKEDEHSDYLSCQEYSLEEAVLSLCINIAPEIKEEVQQLFKGE